MPGEGGTQETGGSSNITPMVTPSPAIVEVNKVAAKIPPFWKEDLEIWFAQVESNFANSGITTDDTKFRAIVASLDGTILKQIKPAVVDPPTTGKYDNIKKHLLDKFDTPEQVKLRKLFSNLELGDRRPTQLLTEMRDLGGDSASEAVLYTLWIDLLPTSVVAVLEGSTENIDGKAVLADKIMQALNRTTVAQTSIVASSDYPREQINSINQRIDKLSQQMENFFDNSRRHRSSSRGRNRRDKSRSKTPHNAEQGGKCYYHRMFGAKARKCTQPCSFTVRDNTHQKN